MTPNPAPESPIMEAEGTTAYDREPLPDSDPLSYRLARDNPLRQVELQCSNYENGKRWCDWCSTVVFPAHPPKHKETCPIHRIERHLKGECA